MIGIRRFLRLKQVQPANTAIGFKVSDGTIKTVRDSNMASGSTPLDSLYDDIHSHLGHVFKNNTNQHSASGLLYVQINGLPLIISSYGSQLAHEVIKDLHKKIDLMLGSFHTILHIDKDHFAIILNECTPAQMEEKALDIFRHIVSYQYHAAPITIQLSATIGGTHFNVSPRTADTIDDIINHAYIALHEAKDSYRHYVLFTDKQAHALDSIEQLVLAHSLQQALLENKLCLAFQPIIDRKTLQPAFFECLLRIQNDDGSVTSVGPAIPAVEKMGFIDLIDSVALKLTVKELQEFPELRLAVNVSSITLQQPQWLDMALDLLKEESIASRIILEVTENFEYHHLGPLVQALKQLKTLGCSIALDDFGAGYTSLSHIRMLPIDMIKIDGSFVRHMLHRSDHYAFVQTLIELGQRLNLKTVAEFVENIPLAEAAASLQVDYMQGHHFANASCTRPWLVGS